MLWDFLREAGYRNQFERGWKYNQGKQRWWVVWGRRYFLPRGLDVDKSDRSTGKNEELGDANSWVTIFCSRGYFGGGFVWNIRYGRWWADNLPTAVYCGHVIPGCLMCMARFATDGAQEQTTFSVLWGEWILRSGHL